MTYLLVALLGGCTSSATKHAAAAAAITRTGNATIENFKSGTGLGVGEVARLFHVYNVDGEFVAKGRINGVFTLSPGHHVLTIWAQFTHMTGVVPRRSDDAGQVDLPLDAVAGRRYSIAGREFDRDTAEIWITDMATGAQIGEPKAFPVTTTVQDQAVPIFIPIPIR